MSTPYGNLPSVPKSGVPKPLSMSQVNALNIKGEIKQDNNLEKTLNELRIKEEQKEKKEATHLMAELNKLEKSSTPTQLEAARKAADIELSESSNKCLPGEGCSIMGGKKRRKSKSKSKKSKKGKKSKKRKTTRRRR
jgi:hypothetical protein